MYYAVYVIKLHIQAAMYRSYSFVKSFGEYSKSSFLALPSFAFSLLVGIKKQLNLYISGKKIIRRTH